MTTISLCVIAQDKAPTLPDCIRSTNGIVDEVIILDTGKLNGAGEWAVSNGAKMIPYQWAGDLAEARTAAIRHATGDWVLVLDADEQLAEGAGEIIRAAIEAGGLDCGYLPLVRVEGPSETFDPADMDEDSFSRMPRIAPTDHRPSMGCRGRWRGVNGWIAMRARRVRVVDAPIVKAADVSRSRKPHQWWTSRPVPLRQRDHFRRSGGRSLDEPHGSPINRSHRCAAHSRLGPLPRQRSGWRARRGRRDLDTADTGPCRCGPGGHPSCTHSDFDKQPREALGTIGQALDWGIHHPNIDMLQGVIVENAGMTSLEREHQQTCLERAEAAFLACVTHDAKISARDSCPASRPGRRTPVSGLFASPEDVDGAQLAFEAALESDPEHAEATIGLMECWLEFGDGARILEPLMPYMEANIADAWMLAAAACVRRWVASRTRCCSSAGHTSFRRMVYRPRCTAICGCSNSCRWRACTQASRSPVPDRGVHSARLSRDSRPRHRQAGTCRWSKGRTPRHSLRDCGLGRHGRGHARATSRAGRTRPR